MIQPHDPNRTIRSSILTNMLRNYRDWKHPKYWDLPKDIQMAKNRYYAWKRCYYDRLKHEGR